MMVILPFTCPKGKMNYVNEVLFNREDHVLLAFIETFIKDDSCLVFGNDIEEISVDVEGLAFNYYKPVSKVKFNALKPKFVEEMFVEILNQGCKTFVLTAKNLTEIFHHVYTGVQLANSRNDRRYLVLYQGIKKDIIPTLKHPKMTIFPHLYFVVNCSLDNFNVSDHNIILPSLGDNFISESVNEISISAAVDLINANIDHMQISKSLKNKHFSLLMTPFSPYALALSSGDYEGIDYRIFSKVAKRHNFT